MSRSEPKIAVVSSLMDELRKREPAKQEKTCKTSGDLQDRDGCLKMQQNILPWRGHGASFRMVGSSDCTGLNEVIYDLSGRRRTF